MLTQSEESVLTELNAMQDEIVDLLCSMVRIPTVNPPGEYGDLAHFLQDYLGERGLEPSIVLVEDANPTTGVTTSKHNLLARYRATKSARPDGHQALWLNGHLDTVSEECVPGDLSRWDVPPFAGVVRDGRVWGRGACDSKGRLACYMACATVLARLNVELSGDVVVAATADEETAMSGTTGAGYLTSQGLVDAGFVIVEGMCDEINDANPGEIVLDVFTEGRSLHTSQLLAEGMETNALDHLVRLLTDFLNWGRSLRDREKGVPGMESSVVTIESLHGGGTAGMTSPVASARINIVLSPEHDVDVLLRSVSQVVDDFNSRFPSAAARLVVSSARPGARMAGQPRLVRELRMAAQDLLSIDLPVRCLTGKTDMPYFVRAGAEAVNFGPGRIAENNLHLPNENVRISDLLETSKVITLAILRLLRVKD